MELLFIVPALRLVLGLLLFVTGVLKAKDLKGFSVIVAMYGLLPRALVKPLAYVQPFVEIVVGAWILSGKQLFYGSIAGLLLMLSANVFVLKGLLNKKKMENCGCYGAAIKHPLNWMKFVENLFWTFFFIVLIIASM